MSREVRITIDDDEVFERMKRRKRELDLSWEDVLHRGLRQEDAGYDARAQVADAQEDAPDHGPGAAAGTQGGARHAGRGGGRSAHDSTADQWDRFADSVEAQVQNKVYNALRDTFGAAGIDVPDAPGSSLDREMADLSSAEDAVIAFDFLDDDPAYQVPLRVNLQTSTDGLDVEVVAVREGKNVRHANRFDPETRHTVTKRLASGAPAVLRFDDGAEGYEVEPVLRWERDGDGNPTVTDVEIAAVRLGDHEDEDDDE